MPIDDDDILFLSVHRKLCDLIVDEAKLFSGIGAVFLLGKHLQQMQTTIWRAAI